MATQLSGTELEKMVVQRLKGRVRAKFNESRTHGDRVGSNAVLLASAITAHVFNDLMRAVCEEARNSKKREQQTARIYPETVGRVVQKTPSILGATTSSSIVCNTMLPPVPYVSDVLLSQVSGNPEKILAGKKRRAEEK